MKYLFADEAGNFDFSCKGSKFFIVTAVSMDDFQPGIALLDLRHRLVHRQVELRHDGFHATDDKQAVRDEVFSLLSELNFKVDAVVLEKSKVFPHLQRDEHYFYKMAWYLLFKHIAKRCFPDDEPGLVIAGSLGTKQKLKDFQNSIQWSGYFIWVCKFNFRSKAITPMLCRPTSGRVLRDKLSV